MSTENAPQPAAPLAMIYRPIEALKKWAKANKHNLPEEENTKLKQIIAEIAAGPDAGRPLAISTLEESVMRQIFGLGPDKVMNTSPYKVEVPVDLKKSINKVTRVTGQGRPSVEPFARTLVSLMLVEAICAQGDYTGEDEAAARTSRGQDVVFLDQETRVDLLVNVGGVTRNLNGKVDFAVWYETGKDGMGTNLVAIEAKRLGDARKGIPQCLCYMMIIHHRRLELEKENKIVWGMASDGNEFHFLRVDNDGKTWVSNELKWARDCETIWGLITHVVEQARVLSPMSTRVATKASDFGPLSAPPSGSKSLGPPKKSASSLRGWLAKKGLKRGRIATEESKE